jgi:hypothetical protein
MENSNRELDIEEIFKEENPTKIMCYLKTISDICRKNKWYASSVYAANAADAIFHMSYLGDKAQKPTQYIHLVDVHYSAYPDIPDECS